jgi:hypothetical protein
LKKRSTRRMKRREKFLWSLALAALLAVGVSGPWLNPLKGSAMQPDKKQPLPQPTESEAIVAAQRDPQHPGTRLVPPVPLPVDQAAGLPPLKAAP